MPRWCSESNKLTYYLYCYTGQKSGPTYWQSWSCYSHYICAVNTKSWALSGLTLCEMSPSHRDLTFLQSFIIFKRGTVCSSAMSPGWRKTLQGAMPQTLHWYTKGCLLWPYLAPPMGLPKRFMNLEDWARSGKNHYIVPDATPSTVVTLASTMVLTCVWWQWWLTEALQASWITQSQRLLPVPGMYFSPRSWWVALVFGTTGSLTHVPFPGGQSNLSLTAIYSPDGVGNNASSNILTLRTVSKGTIWKELQILKCKPLLLQLQIKAQPGEGSGGDQGKDFYPSQMQR